MRKEGRLVYRCHKITDGFDLAKYVFWEFKRKDNSNSTVNRSVTKDYARRRDDCDLNGVERQEEEEAKNRSGRERVLGR